MGPVLLCDAVSRGDLDAVRNLMKRQRSVLADLKPDEAESLLREATRLVDPDDMVHLLLEAGLRIRDNVKGDDEGHVASGNIARDEEHVSASLLPSVFVLLGPFSVYASRLKVSYN